MEWKYGDAWEGFPIQAGEIWGTELGRVAVHNLFEPLPEFMLDADLIFIDPPWNLGNLNTFYTKAGRSDYQSKFEDFADAVFQRIKDIDPRTCFVEIGNQNAEDWKHRLAAQFPIAQAWPVTYYRKHPCWILRGSHVSPTRFDYSGMDEAKVIQHVGAHEDYQVIGDFCMGRGLVGLAAHDSGNRFVGTELNPRRLACLLAALEKRGAKVEVLNGYSSIRG